MANFVLVINMPGIAAALKRFQSQLGHLRPGVLVIALSCASPFAALAGEGGVSHIIPGSAATLIDLPPTKPGWIVEGIYLNYKGDASAGKSLPIAGTIAAGLNAESDAFLLGTFHTFESKVLGAHFSVGGFLPYISVDVSADLATQLGTVRRNDSASGLGDMTLIPAMFAWKEESWQYSAFLSIYAPTGQYEEGRLANPGLNYWTFDPTVGVSYNNKKTGLNAALFAGIGLNTENNATGYTSGSVLHFDGSVQQLLPAGPGFLGVGAEAFYIEQVTADSGGNLGDFKGRTAGIGPVLTYILPRGKETLVAELRWLPETSVKNRLDGDYIWLKVVYQF
jgi:hypothetical protein